MEWFCRNGDVENIGRSKFLKSNVKSPIALILCAEKSDEVIELLELDKGDIRVAQYLTAMPSKEELEEKLRLAIQRAKIRQPTEPRFLFGGRLTD